MTEKKVFKMKTERVGKQVLTGKLIQRQNSRYGS